MTENNTHLHSVWTQVSAAIETLFESKSISRETGFKLHNLVHNYFVGTEYENLLLGAPLKKPKPTNESEKKSEPVDVDPATLNLPGGNLYFYLRTYLKDRLTKIHEGGQNLKDYDFLRYYSKAWEQYQLLSQILNYIFNTMNANWVKRQKESGVKGIHTVDTMAMYIWEDLFFKESNQSLTRTCLQLIQNWRNGEYVDLVSIHRVVQSYVVAGSAESAKKVQHNFGRVPTLTSYVDYFEKQFISESELFYERESNSYSEENSILPYLKKVAERLQQEGNLVQNSLHPTTLEKLIPKLEHILIMKKESYIYNGSQFIVRSEKIDDIRILYAVISRSKHLSERIQNDFEEYVYKIGMEAIDPLCDIEAKDYKIYIEKIIEIHQRFLQIVEQGFCRDSGFHTALDKACGKLINDNAVTRKAKQSAKTAELLARYCDSILKKGNKIEANEIETKINQIMNVFNYIIEKDVFQKYYGRMLAKRLVGQLSAADDHEESMISRLKTVCGFEYASKLQRMFQDMRISTNLTEEFVQYCIDNNLVKIGSFPVMVLTSHSWPFTAPPAFNLSIELKPTFYQFEQFYGKKFTGRKLEWLHQHSKGEIQTLYTKTKYFLNVSIYQMVILLLFNQSEIMTVEEIHDASQIEMDLCKAVIFNLIKSKILVCKETKSSEPMKDLKEENFKRTHVVEIDTSFKSKNVRINLNQPIKTVEQKENEIVDRSIDEDRKLLIQAATVRIMKTRLQLRHNELIGEIIPQLSSRFNPSIQMIKKCIDLLIEKEYLRRDDQERDRYHYVA